MSEWWKTAAREAEKFAAETAADAARQSPSGGVDAAARQAEADAIDAARLTPDAVLAYWARTMLDETQAGNMRMKASELGAKHLGMLIERHETRDVTDRRLEGVPADVLAGLIQAVRERARLVDVTPRPGTSDSPAGAAGALPAKRDEPEGGLPPAASDDGEGA